MVKTTVTRLRATASVTTVVARNAGLRQKPAPRVAHVLRELFEPDPRPRPARLVKPLARHQHAAKRPPRGIAGVVWIHAVGDQAIGLDLEVRLDLPLEVVVVPASGRHTTQV